MCYDSTNQFGNVTDLATYEELQDYLDDHQHGTIVREELDLDADAHSHGGHTHSHPHEETEHTHPEMVSDGGTTTISARSPTLDMSQEHLIENARSVVTAEQVKDRWGRSGNIPGYDVAAGDEVLFVVDTAYDTDVVDAFTEAFEAEGAEVDVLNLHFPEKEIHPWYDDVPGVTYPDDPREERFDELKSALTPEERHDRGYRLERRHLTLTNDADWWEEAARNYDLLVYGIGGPTPKDVADRPYEYERCPWRSKSSLASDSPNFPRDLWRLIDAKTAEKVARSERTRLTDPEGTELEWTNYVTEIYPRERPCHVHAHPLLPTSEMDTEGVIKGTTNHANAFPQIEIEIEGGKIDDINDGGEYGEMWRETLEIAEKYDHEYGEIWESRYDEWKQNEGQDKPYDYYDGSPGLFWLFEAAIGTNPKYIRPTDRDPTRFEFPLVDRLRAGVVHLGIGTIPHEMEVKQEIADRGLPYGHSHVHLLFPTLECTMPDGTTETVIDDGYLTVLDDPEVRDLAANYGDPDEVLSVDWVPDIPGVSSDGQYAEYATDPKDWLSRRHS